jgi:hypothetical protein
VKEQRSLLYLYGVRAARTDLKLIKFTLFLAYLLHWISYVFKHPACDEPVLPFPARATVANVRQKSCSDRAMADGTLCFHSNLRAFMD